MMKQGKIRQDNPAFRGAGMNLRDSRAFALNQTKSACIRVNPRPILVFAPFVSFCSNFPNSP